MLNKQPQHLQNWIGREEECEDILTPFQVAGFSAVLDLDDPSPSPGDPAPAGIHWMLTKSSPRNSLLGEDGHGRRGNFIPPVDLPRRMWAGSTLEFMRPLIIGETVKRISRIEDVVIKQGKSGQLVFVTVMHEFEGASGPALRDQQQLVYREPPNPDSPRRAVEKAPDNPEWSRTMVPDAVLLFRYSALTFNGHRIHYDRTYCREYEGYPGLVVHGPLQATLLLDLCRRNKPEKLIRRFEFRAQHPLFDGETMLIAGQSSSSGAELWTAGPQGQVAIKGAAEWDD